MLYNNNSISNIDAMKFYKFSSFKTHQNRRLNDTFEFNFEIKNIFYG